MSSKYIDAVETELDEAAKEYAGLSWWSRYWKTRRELDAREELMHQCRRMSQCLQHMKITEEASIRLCEKLRRIETRVFNHIF